MTATKTESTSETDSSPADRDFAGRTKRQPILRAIKGLFRDAVKALTRRADEEPPPRRRREETEGEFGRLARNTARRFDMRRSFKARAGITSRYSTIGPEAATGTAASALAMLMELNNDSGDDFTEEFDTGQDHITPRL